MLMGNHDRCETLAQYLIEHRTTVRGVAQRFGISKSTVHKDITDRVEKLNPKLARDVRKVLEANKAERHIREEWLPERNIFRKENEAQKILS